MHAAFIGAVAMASLIAALFFLRFWRDTGDRFFLLFAIAFTLDSITRFGLAVQADEQEPLIYLGRLITYGMILAAVIDKNMASERVASPPLHKGGDTRPTSRRSKTG